MNKLFIIKIGGNVLDDAKQLEIFLKDFASIKETFDTCKEASFSIMPPAEVLPDIYFKVQLASYDQGNIKFPEFEALGKVEEIKAYERYIYRLGNFESLERAKEVLELVRSQGYFVAFILQYNKDKVTGIVK